MFFVVVVAIYLLSDDILFHSQATYKNGWICCSAVLWETPYHRRSRPLSQYAPRHQSHFRLVTFGLVIGQNTVTCLSWTSPTVTTIDHVISAVCTNSTLFFYRWRTGEMVCHGVPLTKRQVDADVWTGRDLELSVKIIRNTSITFRFLVIIEWNGSRGHCVFFKHVRRLSYMGHRMKGGRLTCTTRQNADWYSTCIGCEWQKMKDV